jgi:DNA processing protein
VLPDAAFAVALSALAHMTPAKLRLLLDGRLARDVFAQVVAGDPSLIESLAHVGGSTRAASSQQRLDAELNWGFSGSLGALERGRAQARGCLRAWRLESARTSVAKDWADMQAEGIGVVRRGDGAYPERLLRARQVPELLFVRGRLDQAVAPCVGIVGTRRATHYGLEVATELGRELAARGIVVVSGLARGIDAAAHRGALADPDRGIGPLAVVGGGVNVVYPRENRRLWDEVVVAGGLISEAPPGARPESWRFPLRNRIIAALSQVLVVVESSRQGGAMHTVLAADAYGVPVLAVPGSIRSPQSEGTNVIIQEGGAGVVLDVYDVLARLELECAEDGTPISFSPPRRGRAKGDPAVTAGTPRPATTAGTPSPTATPSPAATAATADTSGQSAPAGGSADAAAAAAAAAAAVAAAPASAPAEPPVHGAIVGASSGNGEHPSGRAEREQVIGRCDPTERAVLEAIDYTTTLVDLVCLRTTLDLGIVALAIDRLDELGLVQSDGAGWIRL